MTKGNRKRSNKNKEEPKKEKKEEEKKKTIYEKFPVRTLTQDDANKLKEIFDMSNNISALIRDYATKEITANAMRETAKQIEAEKEPLMVKVANNLYKTDRDYKKLAKSIKEHADIVDKQLILIEGQIAHRYEDYVGALIRHNRFVESVIKSAKVTTVTGHRPDAETKKDEEVLFEKEFDEMTEDDIEKLKQLNTKIKKHLDEKADKDGHTT